MLKQFWKVIVVCLVSQSLVGAELVDEWLKTYNKILKENVMLGKKQGTQTTLVNYQGIRSDSNFRKAIYDLARLPAIETLPKEDQLAMWINAYNILMIKIIVENPKISSVKELDSVFSSIWKKKVGVVAGKTYSLDEIEHDIIRKQFQEPRVHFALNCSAISCPDLANYAYEGKHIDVQLDHQTKVFLENKSKGMAKKGSTLYLSKLFKWYKEDFDSDVKGWLIKNGYLTADAKGDKIRYMNYNWALNSLKQ